MRAVLMVALPLLAAGTAHAGLAQVVPISLPTLDDVGLVALISLVGVVGGLIARRRKK